jgi:hypothetical protein
MGAAHQEGGPVRGLEGNRSTAEKGHRKVAFSFGHEIGREPPGFGVELELSPRNLR